MGYPSSDAMEQAIASQGSYNKEPTPGAVPHVRRNATIYPPNTPPETAGMRVFASGANRNVDTSKHDFDGFLSPLVLEAFGTYMHFNRHLENGTMRDSDNWQKGIPTSQYMKSGFRHFFDWWRFARGLTIQENIVWAICGLLFNAMGYLHEKLKADPMLLQRSLNDMENRRSIREHGKVSK